MDAISVPPPRVRGQPKRMKYICYFQHRLGLHVCSTHIFEMFPILTLTPEIEPKDDG